jgi:hypothetical protein
MESGVLWPIVFRANRKGLPVTTMYLARAAMDQIFTNDVLEDQLAKDSLPPEASFVINEWHARCTASPALRERLRVIDGRVVAPAKSVGDVGAQLSAEPRSKWEIVDVSLSPQTGLIGGCSDHCTLMVAVDAEKSSSLSPDVIKQLQAGGAPTKSLSRSQAYVAIVDNQGTVVDKIGDDGLIKVVTRKEGVELGAESAGAGHGNYARLTINGVKCGINNVGLSVLRIHWDRRRIERLHLDTHSDQGG